MESSEGEDDPTHEEQRRRGPYITWFTEYQRRMWYSLSQGAVARFYGARDPGGGYHIEKIGLAALSFYWFMWINTSLKVGYLLLTYNGWLGIEVHFLDQMSMWDWYLSTTHMVQEQVMWYPKYPMYEILHRQWSLQEAIFARLGRPPTISRKIHRTDFINSFYYPFVVFTGTFALSIQFFFTPKYALNTYALIIYAPEEWDNFWMRLIFCLHECFFMYHAYAYQACTMVVAESMSTSYQHLLEEMTRTVYKLIEMGDLEEVGLSSSRHSSRSYKRGKRGKRSAYRRQMAEDAAAALEDSKTTRRRRRLHPDTKAEGTSYTIMGLINDYRCIMMMVTEHNKWIGKCMGGAQAANYAQFVSDVFMMIQLLKEPDFDLFGISFYVMDACFGMCMLFRMLIILSRLVPASDEFVHSIKCYAMHETTQRKYILKVLPTMRIVSAKLTGYTVQPQSVPTGIHTLINWYICAAMWKRPDDPKRRT